MESESNTTEFETGSGIIRMKETEAQIKQSATTSIVKLARAYPKWFLVFPVSILIISFVLLSQPGDIISNLQTLIKGLLFWIIIGLLGALFVNRLFREKDQRNVENILYSDINRIYYSSNWIYNWLVIEYEEDSQEHTAKVPLSGANRGDIEQTLNRIEEALEAHGFELEYQ